MNKNSIFQLLNHPCNTRNMNTNLALPIFRTINFKNSFISYGPELFNGLPLHIKLLFNESSFYKFKKGIHEYLMQQQTY